MSQNLTESNHEKTLFYNICGEWRLRSACTATQSDQSFHKSWGCNRPKLFHGRSIGCFYHIHSMSYTFSSWRTPKTGFLASLLHRGEILFASSDLLHSLTLVETKQTNILFTNSGEPSFSIIYKKQWLFKNRWSKTTVFLLIGRSVII